MNRIIKFRAWVENSQRMEEDVTYTKDYEIGSSPWHFMQFTGLLDKNGKEIYEGDVVQARYKEMVDGKEVVVEWDGYCFFPFNNGCGGCTNSFQRAIFDNHEIMKVEVIGNIYENPDLIK